MMISRLVENALSAARDVTTLMRIMISRKYPADALKFVPFVAKNVTI
jgi:hypothetical protein